MAEVFHLNARQMNGADAAEKTRGVLDEGRSGPLTVGLDNEGAALEVASLLNGRGLTVQTYQEGSEWLVLGHPADSPEILVWYGPGGWQAATDDKGYAVPKGKEPIIDLIHPLRAIGGRADFSLSNPVGVVQKTSGDKVETVVVMAGSQFMGTGDDELGRKLAVAFFDTMAAVGVPPAVVAFYNTGVFLTTRETPVLASLQELVAQGATLISSSVCLDFFDIKDQVKVGRIGNMYEIINAQRAADRLIRL
ncbi:sulfurtransferase-like selenium metabolism protein YedF [Deltaproteobacteria bacterium Smac51]|nr:sulfurtransferase-like selenium metabolism protein YedF [Deltaproteobacteria bacterium Smac51]